MSQKESQGLISTNREGERSISLYTDEEASLSDIAVSMYRLRTAFPNMENGFFNILAERVAANRFTSKRLADAVNHLIDNFGYKNILVSDLIRFDKKVRLYTYEEATIYATTNSVALDKVFVRREIDGVMYRVKKTDL